MKDQQFGMASSPIINKKCKFKHRTRE